MKEFINEIELLSRIHHKNTVSLVGFCFGQGERMLVYEYICNGSLRDNLDGKFCTHLDWKKRLQIALDSARRLAYLHELTNLQTIHRDVKSTNILLDEHFNAKIVDFGLSVVNRGNEDGHVGAEPVAGTRGYVDPEYLLTGQLSE